MDMAEPVVEHGERARSGDMLLWWDDPERTYPPERRIPNVQREGGKVYTRKVIVVEDWTEAPR